MLSIVAKKIYDKGVLPLLITIEGMMTQSIEMGAAIKLAILFAFLFRIFVNKIITIGIYIRKANSRTVSPDRFSPTYSNSCR